MPSARLCFPKSARLTRASEFQKLKRDGLSFHGKFFVLSVLKDLPAGEVRVGLITSRRVGGAVERNRVRRRLREIVRLSAATSLSAGHDYVLIGRRAALSLPFEQLIEDFKRALRRLRVPQ